MKRLRIVIDTREQTPWHFPDHLAEMSRCGLNAGDYALEGDYLYAIERKSADDFVGTVSSGWDRFLRELERMEIMVARTIIVETSMSQIIAHRYNHPQVKPQFVIKRIAELSLMSVSVLFCDNPVTAAGMAYAIFKLRHQMLEQA